MADRRVSDGVYGPRAEVGRCKEQPLDTIDTHIGKTLVVVSCSVENMHAINHLASSVQKMRATAPWTRIVRPPLFSMKDCQTCQNVKKSTRRFSNQ